MKNDVRQILKSVIEENAVNFKNQTSKILYSKVGDKLKQEYVNVSKKLFNTKGN